jgi:hypothetical protein
MLNAPFSQFLPTLTGDQAFCFIPRAPYTVGLDIWWLGFCISDQSIGFIRNCIGAEGFQFWGDPCLNFFGEMPYEETVSYLYKKEARNS